MRVDSLIDNAPEISKEQWDLIKDDIEEAMFSLPSTYEMWPIINEIREKFGFQDYVPDEDMIKENKWAIEQYRRYVSTKTSSLSKAWEDPEEVLAILHSMYSSVSDDFTDRQTAIYQTLRDSWLVNSINLIIGNSFNYGGE